MAAQLCDSVCAPVRCTLCVKQQLQFSPVQLQTEAEWSLALGVQQRARIPQAFELQRQHVSRSPLGAGTPPVHQAAAAIQTHNVGV